jgi:hypothetical protein
MSYLAPTPVRQVPGRWDTGFLGYSGGVAGPLRTVPDECQADICIPADHVDVFDGSKQITVQRVEPATGRVRYRRCHNANS